MKEAVLVTGGAGYIGSHFVKKARSIGMKIVVLDDLSTGRKENVPEQTIVVGDIGNQHLVAQLIKEHKINTVVHFAAKTIVPESIENPLKYYNENTIKTAALLEVCQTHGVENFILSSTAAVYGMPKDGVASEDTVTNPINPYGASKLVCEWMLRDVANASNMRYVILRYFNVSGCDPDGEIGQSNKNATLLIKVACEVAFNKRDTLSIFGTDFDTPDGTGIRDYIHVDDLCEAHIKAISYLHDDGASTILNCGYGVGISVRQVVKEIENATGKRLPVHEAERRPGDPAKLIAKADKIRSTLGWQPKYNDIKKIVDSNLAWEKKLS